MWFIKKTVYFIFILILLVVTVFKYRNDQLYERSKTVGDSQEKIDILERSIPTKFSTDLVNYELGKSYFDLGIQNLSDKNESIRLLQKAVKNFRQAIQINPASEFSHFYLGQSLFYIKALLPQRNDDPFEEYKKAIRLTGFNSQIFLEVGKIFLSKWSDLSEEDKEFAQDIVKKVLSKKNVKHLHTVLNYWDMNVGELDLLEEALPEDPKIFRAYANFLGEKSRSTAKRHEYLSKAEFLEYEETRSQLQAGETALLYFRLNEAYDHFYNSLTKLQGIRFYQNLLTSRPIDEKEFLQLKKSVLLNLTKCRIYLGAGLKDVKDYLQAYLELETDNYVLGELESFLEERGLLEERMDDDFKDLDTLRFKLSLFFKLNRYREILRVGRLIKNGVISAQENFDIHGYIELLNIIGDAYHKIDNVYDAGDLYLEAYEFDRENIETLVRMLNNYVKRNDEKMVMETENKIQEVLSPPELSMKIIKIDKGRELSQNLRLDGSMIVAEVHFNQDQDGGTPLVTVLFNDLVVWEENLTSDRLKFSAPSNIGDNSLVIIPVNKPMAVTGINYTRNPQRLR